MGYPARYQTVYSAPFDPASPAALPMTSDQEQGKAAARISRAGQVACSHDAQRRVSMHANPGQRLVTAYHPEFPNGLIQFVCVFKALQAGGHL